MSEGVSAMLMRGGTSKGIYLMSEDIPKDIGERDRWLLSIMGSPDARQIDGVGGANPLTSKVAIIDKSKRHGCDIDYLFLQVSVDQAVVSDAQNCGNILAGVAPFAIERGLVPVAQEETDVVIFMENTGQLAKVTVQTPRGNVIYSGLAEIDGVPGSAAPVPVEFQDTAGSLCGALLPTGNEIDIVDGLPVTMIDNGMPVVTIRAADLGVSGYEACTQLEENDQLRARLEKLRLSCGKLMNLGDVANKTVPKMTLISPPKNGGAINTRTFIPHRCHASIGVLGAVSVASASLLKGSTVHALADIPNGHPKPLAIEHPAGQTTIVVQMDEDTIVSSAVLRTARKLFDGLVFASI